MVGSVPVPNRIREEQFPATDEDFPVPICREFSQKRSDLLGFELIERPPTSLYLHGLIADEQQNARGSALFTRAHGSGEWWRGAARRHFGRFISVAQLVGARTND
jgi:hypothetical protein